MSKEHENSLVSKDIQVKVGTEFRTLHVLTPEKGPSDLELSVFLERVSREFKVRYSRFSEKADEFKHGIRRSKREVTQIEKSRKKELDRLTPVVEVFNGDREGVFIIMTDQTGGVVGFEIEYREQFEKS